MVEVITKSRLAAFNLCQRYHQNTYNLGYRALTEREDADFGSLFHAGLDAWWSTYKDAAMPETADTVPFSGLALSSALSAMADYRSKAPAVDDAAFAKASVMMVAYDARWAPTMHELEVIGVEVEFVAMVPGRKRLRVAGKFDKLVRKRIDGSIWFVEHKTTGADLSAGSTYWNRLRMDPQVSIYFGGCRALGYEPEGCFYDVIVRPSQRPLKATPEDQRKYTKDGRLYAKQRESDETVEEFRDRLAGLISKAPDGYFARGEVVRLESELEESARDVEATALQIRELASIDHAPRNPGACHMYGRTCAFFDACSGVASLDDETKFRRTENVHEELSIQAGVNGG